MDKSSILRRRHPRPRPRYQSIMNTIVIVAILVSVGMLCVNQHIISQHYSRMKAEKQLNLVSMKTTHNKQDVMEDVPPHVRDKRLPRILALVFPQFHRDAINDNLWGVGFTDWNNLKNAPLKNRLGLDIPQPTELGFYDLTDVEPRRKQGELAKQYGLDGFIYHHYWFYDEKHPGPNLHAPLEAMLKDGHPDIPFAFNWVSVIPKNTTCILKRSFFYELM